MPAAILDWIDKRFPYRALLSLGRDEEIPGGASFFYALGSATLFAFLIQVVTGIWQLFYYVPTVDHAYDSLSYLRTEVDFGWLIHGLHYWGANLMSVLVGLHIIRVFTWGAYKNPRQLTWVTGVLLFFLVAGLIYTGSPLPWDEAGYWVAIVGTSILGTVPLIGSFLADVVRGGGSLGPLALSRFFTLHAAILPAAVVVLIGLHMIAFRQFGSVGPWQAEKRQTSGPFWPDQIYKDLIVSALLLVLLVFLSAYCPPPITGPADPTDTSYQPVPEWNFLFLFEALKFLPGRLEPLGTVGIPSLAVILLVGLPFYDRNPDRNPAHRPRAMGAMVLAVVVISTLTVAALRSSQSVATVASKAPEAAGKLSASAVAGQKIFESMGCTGCHKVQGQGGTIGPDLTNIATERTRSWVVAQIENPKVHDPQSIMPPYASLGSAKTDEIVDYLFSLTRGTSVTAAAATGQASGGTGAPAADPGPTPTTSSSAAAAAAAAGAHDAAAGLPAVHPGQGPPGRAATIVGSAEHGATLFAIYCATCHGHEGRGGVPNPGAATGHVPALNPISVTIRSSNPGDFAENLDRFLQHGAIPGQDGGALTMPAFGQTATLTQAEIADIEAYVMQQNGVNRAAILSPGIAPRRYFWMTAGAGAVLALLLAAGWALARGRPAAP